MNTPLGGSLASRPTQAGRFLWRLPETEKSGTYILLVEVAPDPENVDTGLQIFTDEGDRICSLAQAKAGEFKPLAVMKALTLKNGKKVCVLGKKNPCTFWIAETTVPSGVDFVPISDFKIEDNSTLHNLPTLRRSQVGFAA